MNHVPKQGQFINLDEIQELLLWADKVGIQINPKLQYPVRYPPGYLGMSTQVRIGPSETLLTVPNEAMLSTKIVKTQELQDIYDDYPSLFLEDTSSSVDYLTITYIYYEYSKGRQSYWYPYLNSLPKNPDNLTD